MIYKYISSKQVIAKVLSDLDLDEESLRISDMREWCGEAVERIGSVRQLQRVITDGPEDSDNPLIKISGYQASMPINLFRLNSVAYATSPNGYWFPMTVSTGSFGVVPSQSISNDDVTSVANDVLIAMLKSIYDKMSGNFIYAWFNKMSYEDALSLLEADFNLKSLLVGFAKQGMSSSEMSLSTITPKYTIKPGYIVTNMPSGYLKLSYDAIPMDKDGYPLIPDLVSYTEAIYWYIAMKLTYPEYYSGRINREIYYDMKRSWNFYCKQAYGESMMPNQDEMETIKNVWHKLIPDYNAQNTSYDNIGEVQSINSFNR